MEESCQHGAKQQQGHRSMRPFDNSFGVGSLLSAVFSPLSSLCSLSRLPSLSSLRLLCCLVSLYSLSSFSSVDMRHRDGHFRENSVSSSCHFREGAGGNLPQYPHHKRKMSQETLSDRERISTSSRKRLRFSDLEDAARLFLEEQRDHLLAEAKSEILKQECKR